MLGVELHPEALARFRKFHDFMVEKNKVMNLTGITEDAEAARLHYLDCCALLAAEDFKNKKVIDVGTGAGFPGVPLKIAEPSMDITLLDSLAKRINFLDEAVALAGLEGVTTIHARAEEPPAEYREAFDIATARAVTRLDALCELCLTRDVAILDTYSAFAGDPELFFSEVATPKRHYSTAATKVIAEMAFAVIVPYIR